MKERKEEQHFPSGMNEASCGMYNVHKLEAGRQSEQAAVSTPRRMRKWRAPLLAFQTGSAKRSRGRGPEASSDRDRNILLLADTIAVRLFGKLNIIVYISGSVRSSST